VSTAGIGIGDIFGGVKSHVSELVSFQRNVNNITNASLKIRNCRVLKQETDWKSTSCCIPGSAGVQYICIFVQLKKIGGLKDWSRGENRGDDGYKVDPVLRDAR
jgi:hypothetical protein